MGQIAEMKPPVKNKKDAASMQQLNMLLAQTSLTFKAAALKAGIPKNKINDAMIAFWRGSKTGEAYEMRRQVLAALTKIIREQVSDEVVPL